MHQPGGRWAHMRGARTDAAERGRGPRRPPRLVERGDGAVPGDEHVPHEHRERRGLEQLDGEDAVHCARPRLVRSRGSGGRGGLAHGFDEDAVRFVVCQDVVVCAGVGRLNFRCGVVADAYRAAQRVPRRAPS